MVGHHVFCLFCCAFWGLCDKSCTRLLKALLLGLIYINQFAPYTVVMMVFKEFEWLDASNMIIGTNHFALDGFLQVIGAALAASPPASSQSGLKQPCKKDNFLIDSYFRIMPNHAT